MNTYILIVVLIVVIISNNLLLQKKIENFPFDYDNLPEYDIEQNDIVIQNTNNIQENSDSISGAISQSNDARVISSNAVDMVTNLNQQFTDTLVSVNEQIAKQSATIELMNVVKYGDRVRIRHKNGPTFLNKAYNRFRHENYYHAYTYFIIVGKRIGTPVKYKDVVYLRSNVGSHRVLQQDRHRWGRFANNNTQNWERIRFISKRNTNSSENIKRNDELYIKSDKYGGYRNRYLQLWGGNRYYRDQRFHDGNLGRHNYWKTLQII